jgi:hypothetical protein
MSGGIGGRPKIDLVSKNLHKVARVMVKRAMKGETPAERYRVAIFAYNDQVLDLTGGAITLDAFLNKGTPVMQPMGRTDTARAFQAAEELLLNEWDNIQHCPAPLICHMTDGEYNEGDPLPIAKRIMQMHVSDGNVLIENIFLDGSALPEQADPYEWPGISKESQLGSRYARHLFKMSSGIPSSYLELFKDRGYPIRPDARLLFPGDTPEMVEAGFMMSGMTPTA